MIKDKRTKADLLAEIESKDSILNSLNDDCTAQRVMGREYLDRLHSIDEFCSLLVSNPQLSMMTKQRIIWAIHDLSAVNANSGR